MVLYIKTSFIKLKMHCDHHYVSHTLKSLGKTSVGWPRITKRRELSLRRLASKSSKHCSKNLRHKRHAYYNLITNKCYVQ